MTLDELYGKYDMILTRLNVTKLDNFIFDLTDENTQKSLKTQFQGIESVLMPECGQYLVVTTFVENSDCLLLLFPEQVDGNLALKVLNTKTHRTSDLTATKPTGEKLTIDNFSNFANMEELTTRFNEFVFNAEGENSTNEVQNIGSFDVSNDEPVDITNTTTDNEETKMTFKPIKEEEETKWVEIPNTNAHGITVTEDGEEAAQEDPFAGEAPAADGGDATATPPADDGTTTDAAPEGGDASADAPAPEGDASADAPVDGGDATTDAAPTIDDPKAKMRELLAYYTNYMTELVQDPNTSTELISATQEMIDSLISNMESADAIEEVQGAAEEEANQEVTTEEPPADTGDASAEPVAEDTEEENKIDDPNAEMDAKIDADVDALHANDWEDIAPTTSDNILTPQEQDMAMMDNVDIAGLAPTPDEDLMATTPDMSSPAPTSDVDVLADTEDLTPDEEDSLLGADDAGMVGADGLPVDKFEGGLEALAPTTVAKKINWSSDYALNGVATSDDNTMVVPAVLQELAGYYTKVADEVSKVPGKEDVAMKLQKIQILSQTIANEWNAITTQLDGACANSFDRGCMSNLEKDEVDSIGAMNQVATDVMAQAEQDEEDDLAIQQEIQAFAESFKHLI